MLPWIYKGNQECGAALFEISHCSLVQAALTTQSGLQCQQVEALFVLATSYSTASSPIQGQSVHTNSIMEPAHSSLTLLSLSCKQGISKRVRLVDRFEVNTQQLLHCIMLLQSLCKVGIVCRAPLPLLACKSHCARVWYKAKRLH